MKIMLLILLFFLVKVSTWSCTTFVIQQDDELLFGRNLDWVSNNGLMINNLRRVRKRAITFGNDTPLEWVSNYGSITFNQFGKEFPYGGMNEKGMVIELMLAPSKYVDNPNLNSVNELQWIQYMLDKAENVQEVIALNNQVRISKVAQNLHYFICDKKGNRAVIEFINGKTVIFQGDNLPYSVLENDNYKTSINKKEKNVTCRFNTAVELLENIPSKVNLSEYAFQVLDEVALDGSWRVVYDIKNLQIHFKTNTHLIARTINLESFNWDCKQPSLMLRIPAKLSGDVTEKFVSFSTEENTEIMLDALEKNYIILPKKIRDQFINHHLLSECKMD